MTLRTLALLLLVFPAWAQSPADFRSHADLTLTSKEALHRFALPPEAYRDARRDLADLRVFNGKDEMVPFAFAGEAERAREAASMVELKIFPVMAAVPGAAITAAGNVDITVRVQADGTLVSVQQRPGAAAKAPARAVSWVLDASALPKPMQAITVEWDTGPGSEVVRASVEASDDLKSWQPLATRAPLVRLEQGGQVLSQPRIEFAPRKAKYLRVTGEGNAFVLRAVKAELTTSVTPIERTRRAYPASAGEKAGEFVVDLGARVPVEAVRVVFADNNSIAPAEILSRDPTDRPWQPAASASFYRLTRNGAEIESPAIDVGRRPDRYWLIRIDPRTGGVGRAAPSLEVSWRPVPVVFVARGDAPFRVAFGKPDAPRASLPVETLMPGYERFAEYQLPEAKVGAVSTTEATSMQRISETLGVQSPKRIGLWAILLAGVGLLAFMAWRLMGQVKKARPEPPPGEGPL